MPPIQWVRHRQKLIPIGRLSISCEDRRTGRSEPGYCLKESIDIIRDTA